MLREATAGMRELAEALRRLDLPTHVEHTVVVEPSIWLAIGFVAGVLLVWVVQRWK